MNIPTLENKLFKSGLYLAIVLVVLLELHDVFVINDYPSMVIEAAALIVVVYNLILLRRRPATQRQILLFSLFILVLINLGWHTGGGVNLLTVSVYFITGGTLMMLFDKKYYRWIAIIVLIDILVLYYIEKTIDLEIFKKTLEVGKNKLERDYLYAFILFFFGGFLIAFIKNNFNKERDKLHDTNEELSQTKRALDQTVTDLREQKEELEAVKENLEQKVEERTQDLGQVNERLVRKNQQLEQYGYIISHNLKAPVAQIKGLVHILPNAENFDSITRETLVRLTDSAVQLEKVLTDLSTILRVEKNMQQSWENVVLAVVMAEVKESVKSSLDEKQVAFHCTYSDLPEITAIKAYVYSVLHNIIENAVKYADLTKEDRFVKISVSESNTFHIITITDNGLGIDMAAATGKMFQLYQRFNTTHPGQGIGLFLVKSQMEAMSGRVEMDSILGQGTTFTLWFAKMP